MTALQLWVRRFSFTPNRPLLTEKYERKDESIWIMTFDYFYERQSARFSFFRIPKSMITEGPLKHLTADAKLLYGLLLDRVSLSRKQGWIDKEKRVYVFCTIENIKEVLNCANSKACATLKELEDLGLIEKKKQGFGKPAVIYVKDCTRFRNPEQENSEKQNSPVPENGIHAFRKSECNNTKNNNTEIIYTDPILSGADKDGMDREKLWKHLFDRLEMSILYEEYPHEKETLDSILYLIFDVICSKRNMIRIAGDDKPLEVVKSRFMKLNMMHIEYVMDCMHKNPAKIRNIKQYLLAAIYNAPLTMQSYYQAWVNNDMTGGNQEE